MSTWRLDRGRTGKAIAYVRGSKADAVAAAKRLAPRFGSVAVLPNPTRLPRAGEIWRGIRGDRCRIVKADGSQVTVLQLDTGHRVTSDLADFLATYKPPPVRLNRTKRKGPKRPLSRPTTPPQGGPGTSVSGRGRSNPGRGGPRIVYNKLLGGWYVVTGPHQTPLNGRFNSKAEAQAWLAGSGVHRTTGRFYGNTRSNVASRRRRSTRNTGASRSGIRRSPSGTSQLALDRVGRRRASAHPESEIVRLRRHQPGHAKVRSRSQSVSVAGRGRSNPSPRIGSIWVTRDYPRHVARVSSNERARGGMPPMVNLEITNTSESEIYGRSRIPVNEFWARYEPLISNPSRSPQSRAGRAARRRARRSQAQGLGGRRVLKAISRGQTRRAQFYALRSKHRYRALHPAPNPKGRKPTTVREAIALVIDAAKFPVVAKEVRSGKQDPVKSLEFVRRFMSTEKQRATIDAALRLARKFPARLLDHPAQNPPRTPRRQRRAVASGRFAKARHHAASTITRGVRHLDTQRRAAGRGRVRLNPGLYDMLGNGIAVGSVLVGTGLQNAGPSYTVKIIRGKRVQLEEHLTGRLFWTFPRHYRVDVSSNPKGRKNPIALGGHVPSLRGFVTIRRDGVKGYHWKVEHAGRVVATGDPVGTITEARREINRAVRALGGILKDTIIDSRSTVRPNRRRMGRVRSRKVRGKGRGNPRTQDLARARRTFRRLNEIEPEKVTRTHGAKNAPRVAVKVGELVSFKYLSDKYAGSEDNPDGKTQLYEHTTRRPRPVLATNAEGNEVHIVGGRMRWTPDGAVN